MYYYHFTHYAGNDRVFVADQTRGQPGDLLHIGQEYLLVLGEDVAWKEQHTKKRKPWVEPQVLIAWLLSEKSLTMLHRMVEQWFTTYRNTLPLRLGDIDELLKRKPSGEKKKKSESKISHDILIVTKEWFERWESSKGQQLIVFPDLRTLESYRKEEFKSSATVVLHSQTSAKQKAEAFWKIKNGQISSVRCTYSQQFQDWASLTDIALVDQHKRYYKSQQDPRYFVPTVVEKLAEITGAALQKSGYQL